jgi:hypothetical protein
LSEVLHKPKSPGEIAALCMYQMRRNEQARVARWRAKGFQPPPRRRAA